MCAHRRCTCLHRLPREYAQGQALKEQQAFANRKSTRKLTHCKAHTKMSITEGSEENTPILICIISTLHKFLNLKKWNDTIHINHNVPLFQNRWHKMQLQQHKAGSFACTSKISRFLPNSINTKASHTNAPTKKKKKKKRERSNTPINVHYSKPASFYAPQ